MSQQFHGSQSLQSNIDEFDDEHELRQRQIQLAVHGVINALVGILVALLHDVVSKRPRYTLQRNIQRETYLSRLYFGSDFDCVDMVRMKREPFFKLCDLLRSRRLLVDTLNVRIEEQIAMLLHVLGHSVRNRVIRFNFQRSGETISRYFNAGLYAVGELRHELIIPPTLQTPYKIQTSSRFMPFFQDCIGAIDGTHIKARVPEKYISAFRGRKPYRTQNVLAAVDFDLRFTYVLAGWEGSAHDATVLRNALERSDGLHVPEGKYYLADGGYSTRKGFLSPYRATRYHLKKFSNVHPSNSKELFNLRHSASRTTVERAFGSLKNRFKIIKSDPHFPLETQVNIVLVCCILHNWIITNGGDDFILSEDQWTSNEQHRRGVQTIGNESQEWLAKRDEIANVMWHRMEELGY